MNQGDLLTAWLLIQQDMTDQINSLKGNRARDQMRTPIELDRSQYYACFGYITTTALRLVHEH